MKGRGGEDSIEQSEQIEDEGGGDGGFYRTVSTDRG